MIKLDVTYHMSNQYETAETVATFPMDENTAQILMMQASGTLPVDQPPYSRLMECLINMSAFQGYTATLPEVVDIRPTTQRMHTQNIGLEI